MDSPFAETMQQPASNLRSTFLFWLIWILWLPLFIPVMIGFVQSHPSPLRLAIGILGAAAFFTLYLWISWQSARALAAHTPRVFLEGMACWAPIVALIALAVGLTLLNGFSWGSLFFYAASGVGGWLPPRRAAVVVLGLMLFIGLSLGLTGDFADAISPIAFVGIIGAIVIAFNWSLINSQQLRLAREEMAQAAAISEERLRIARDLHDLLGHNLSLIALKSELARRLASVDPERAASEMGDIEQVARQALREVREAVASYRQPTLATELHGAREMLAAAGVAYHFEGETDATRGLPSGIESALAWAVREGATNVIRHSGARHCTIRVARSPDEISVEVRDDGRGAPAFVASDAGSGSGNGLRGLAERIAALGGRFAAGPVDGGGYRLVAAAPLVAGAHSPEQNGLPGADSAQKTIGASQA